MTINKAKASAYNTVTTAAVYDYMRQYLAEISRMIEPEEDGTGNAYKAKLQQMEGVNRQTLKTCAAELETVVKRLKYAIEVQVTNGIQRQLKNETMAYYHIFGKVGSG